MCPLLCCARSQMYSVYVYRRENHRRTAAPHDTLDEELEAWISVRLLKV